MDKQLLKAYIRTVVEDEVRRILPEVIGEAISVIEGQGTVVGPVSVRENALPKPPKLSRERLAELIQMDIDDDGETIHATAMRPTAPLMSPTANMPPEMANVAKAITRDYSDVMKKMGIA